MNTFEKLDEQMEPFKNQLLENVKLTQKESNNIASKLNEDFIRHKQLLIDGLKNSDRIKLTERYDEFNAFQNMMDIVG